MVEIPNNLIFKTNLFIGLPKNKNKFLKEHSSNIFYTTIFINACGAWTYANEVT